MSGRYKDQTTTSCNYLLQTFAKPHLAMSLMVPSNIRLKGELLSVISCDLFSFFLIGARVRKQEWPCIE